MANQAAIRVHCRLGDEVIADPYGPHHQRRNRRTGGQFHHGVMESGPSTDPTAVFTGDQVKAALRDPNSRNAPRSRLVSIEDTSNGGFGIGVAAGHHARASRPWRARRVSRCTWMAPWLCNASVKSGVKASDYAACVRILLWLDYTKGLGAPVGASLAGSKDFIKEAWRHKQMLGGSMRQSGVIAAAALYALGPQLGSSGRRP